MRLVIMGTGPFAVPTFQSLIESEHQIAALVTRPTVPPRGRSKAPPTPMRDVAEAHGVTVLALDDVNSESDRQQVAALKPELLVVCDFGQILSRKTLAVSPLGGINLHASLLPKYRGAAPINWAIYHGETETGLTVIHMSPKLDAGPCLVQTKTPIGPDETAVELEQRLARMGIESVHESIAMLAAWDGQSVIGTRQDPALTSRAPRLKKTDGEVDWTRTAQQIRNQIRAFQPWPGTYTHWQRTGSEPLRLILDQVSIDSETSAISVEPGQVTHCDDRQLWIATGSSPLSLERVQPASKRVMLIDEFLRGHAVRLGDKFGGAEIG
jgi:methionyl-tRNA formyltransferase